MTAGADSSELTVWAPAGIGEVRPGDSIARLIIEALSGGTPGGETRPGCSRLIDGDIVLVTSKIVSKAEGRIVAAQDREAAISDQTVRVVASREHPGGVTRIVENRLGLVMAAAGVDMSNTPAGTALLLPEDPDASARAIRADLERHFAVKLAVIITDTAGRAWRQGLVDIAIGCAGIVPVDDLRGGMDAQGRPLTATVTAIGDEIAAASELVRPKAGQRPVAIMRGLGGRVCDADGPGARALLRDPAEDMFRQGSAEAYAQGFADGKRSR